MWGVVGTRRSFAVRAKDTPPCWFWIVGRAHSAGAAVDRRGPLAAGLGGFRRCDHTLEGSSAPRILGQRITVVSGRGVPPPSGLIVILSAAKDPAARKAADAAALRSFACAQDDKRG